MVRIGRARQRHQKVSGARASGARAVANRRHRPSKPGFPHSVPDCRARLARLMVGTNTGDVPPAHRFGPEAPFAMPIVPPVGSTTDARPKPATARVPLTCFHFGNVRGTTCTPPGAGRITDVSADQGSRKSFLAACACVQDLPVGEGSVVTRHSQLRGPRAAATQKAAFPTGMLPPAGTAVPQRARKQRTRHWPKATRFTMLAQGVWTRRFSPHTGGETGGNNQKRPLTIP